MSRLEELAADLERRVESCTRDVALMRDQRERLLQAIVDGQRLMDEDVAKLEGLRQEMVRADERALEIKQSAERQEEIIREPAAPSMRCARSPPKSTCSARPRNRT